MLLWSLGRRSAIPIGAVDYGDDSCGASAAGAQGPAPAAAFFGHRAARAGGGAARASAGLPRRAVATEFRAAPGRGRRAFLWTKPQALKIGTMAACVA